MFYVKHFKPDIIVTAVGLFLAMVYGYLHGFGGKTMLAGALAALFVTTILSILEVSLSFDNCVVNAKILGQMDEKWGKIFLTWGILIAVFGMRLVFPVAIVMGFAHLDLATVVNLAMYNPTEYAHHLHVAHPAIAALGGMHLLLVFLNFIFDEGREIHWFKWIEEKLCLLGKFDSISIVVALVILLSVVSKVPEAMKLTILSAGIGGVILYTTICGISDALSTEVGGKVVRQGLAAFFYLELIDASFSFDGVIGAFAITREVAIIMLGLGIGAMFVRSLTLLMVRKGTLGEFIFLEHGAHYAIGILAIIMMISTTGAEIPEVVTGLTGVVFIVWAVISSILHNKREARLVPPVVVPEAV